MIEFTVVIVAKQKSLAVTQNGCIATTKSGKILWCNLQNAVAKFSSIVIEHPFVTKILDVRGT